MSKSTIGGIYFAIFVLLIVNVLTLVGGVTARLVLVETILVTVGLMAFTVMLIMSDD